MIMERLPVECIMIIARQCHQHTLAALARSAKSFRAVSEIILYENDRQVCHSVLYTMNDRIEQNIMLAILKKAARAHVNLATLAPLSLPFISPPLPVDSIPRGMHYATPLHWAARRGFDDVVDYLLGHFDVNVSTLTDTMMVNRIESGFTALFMALYFGKDSTATRLLRSNAKVTPEQMPMTALHIAAATGCVNTMNFLIKVQHMSVDVQDANGCTALLYALRPETPVIAVVCLAELGADVNITVSSDGAQLSALSVACLRDNWASAIKLLQFRADVYDSQSTMPWRRLNLAQDHLPVLSQALCDVSDQPEQKEFIENLLTRGVDPNEEILWDDEDSTRTGSIVFRMVANDQHEDLEYLLQTIRDLRTTPIDFEKRNSEGQTCLAYALSERKESPMVSILLEYGAKIPEDSLDLLYLLRDAVFPQDAGDTLEILGLNHNLWPNMQVLYHYCQRAERVSNIQREFLEVFSRIQEELPELFINKLSHLGVFEIVRARLYARNSWLSAVIQA